jgi:hypothetical protein
MLKDVVPKNLQRSLDEIRVSMLKTDILLKKQWMRLENLQAQVQANRETIEASRKLKGKA